jgi:GNAT superfamily N-acetyltransferase
VGTHHLTHLDRKAYVNSISKISDPRSLGFANLALQWWDRHFSWKAQGCVALADEKEVHLCYIFYKIDRYGEYLTIHNLFTPAPKRRHGHAHELLAMIFDLAIAQHVGRFKLSCVPQSLDFYLTLGFVYWGLNSVGDYYCDLPLPDEGLDALGEMVAASDVKSLAGSSLGAICKKVEGNEETLDTAQRDIHAKKCKQMGSRYMRDALEEATEG